MSALSRYDTETGQVLVWQQGYNKEHNKPFHLVPQEDEVLSTESNASKTVVQGLGATGLAGAKTAEQE